MTNTIKLEAAGGVTRQRKKPLPTVPPNTYSTDTEPRSGRVPVAVLETNGASKGAWGSSPPGSELFSLYLGRCWYAHNSEEKRHPNTRGLLAMD